MGAEVIVHLDALGSIVAVAGETLLQADTNTVPFIDAAMASRTALDLVAGTYSVDSSQLAVSQPSLWVYDPSLIGPERGPARLVWRMDVSPRVLEPIRELVLVDAERGTVALHFNQVETIKNRATYTSNHTTTLPGTLVCTEANPACAGGDADAVAAHVYAGHTYDYYLANHGRDSLNNAGMTLVSSVHYREPGYQNAFWNGSQMAYGDGFSQADDVVGHELTHGVTQFSSNLFYYYQSGAINESFSDVFGEFIDLTNGNGDETAANRWKLGEELGTIRNMQNPPALGDPDKMTSTLYYAGTADNGGVHTNSGINNKAASLIVDGGVFNGQIITGIGISKASKIYYEVQTHLLTSGSDYGDLFEALFQGCNNLIGVAGITVGDCVQVRNATLATEMQLQPVPGFNPEAPLCAPGQVPVTTFFDNLESGAGNFAFSFAAGSQRWSLFSSYAHSGVRSLLGNDFPIGVADSSAALNGSVVLPANAYLHFAHAFGFQAPNQDGGVIEYSTNAGGAWTDAGALIDSNGYRDVIPAGTNPLAGRAAFTGRSHGYISSRLNLSSLAGQSVRFRWRIGLDASGVDQGWWVDDVRIYSCSGAGITQVTPNTATQSSSINVAVTGQSTHFVQGQTVASFGPGITVHGTTVTDATHASVHISVASEAALGTRDVMLTTGAEVAVGLNAFNVTPGPRLVRVTPNRGQPGQLNLPVEISATLTHFVQGLSVPSFGPGITVTQTVVSDATHLTAQLTIDPNATLGRRTATVTTGAEVAALTNGFTVRRLPSQLQPVAYIVGRRDSPSQGGTDGIQFVTAVDSATNTIAATIPVGVGCRCVGADGIAASPDGASVYVTNEIANSVSVIDTVTRTVIDTIPLGPGGPIAVAVSPDSSRLYVLMGSGTTAVYVIDTSTNAIVGSIPLAVIQARGMAITPDGSRLYVSTYGSNSVKVIDTAANTVIASIPVIAIPVGVDISPDGAFVYVASPSMSQGTPGTVSVINTVTNTVVTAPQVGMVPYSTKVSPDGTKAYATSTWNPGVWIIDTVSKTVAGTIPGASPTFALAFTPDSSRAYLATVSGFQIINATTNSVLGSIPYNSSTNGQPLSIAMSPGTIRGLMLSGNLAFGSVPLGKSRSRVLTITNTGNAPLSANSLTVPAGFTASFGGATVAAGGSQQVVVTFTPAKPGSYGGTLAVSGNQTTGKTTIAVSGYGASDSTREGDFDRDAATDITVFRPSNGTWHTLKSGSAFAAGASYAWGTATDIPVPGDYDGDGQTDVAVYRPASGHWFILRSSGNFASWSTYQWGTPGDVPVAGDYDGDGRSDIAVYRPSSGGWYILQSGSEFTTGLGYFWGAAGDVPVPGEYDGDGKTDIAVYRPGSGHWFILRSSGNFASWSTYQWGTPGDIPVANDYDGDNRRDLAVFRPSNGTWYVLLSASGFTAGAGYAWGTATDVPVPGDYDRDGRTDVAVYRPATGHWFILKSTTNYTSHDTYQWGTTGDVPVTRRQ